MDDPDSRDPFHTYLERLISLAGNKPSRTIAQFAQQTESYISKLRSGSTATPGYEKLHFIAAGLAEMLIQERADDEEIGVYPGQTNDELTLILYAGMVLSLADTWGDGGLVIRVKQARAQGAKYRKALRVAAKKQQQKAERASDRIRGSYRLELDYDDLEYDERVARKDMADSRRYGPMQEPRNPER
jgi:transcriptional regulator with XRE-family HTH domain